MKIVGAGLQKTGVTTLVAALRVMGYKARKASNLERLRYLNTGGGAQILDHCDAVADHPAPFLLQALSDRHPIAVVLTTRATPEDWHQSLVNHLEHNVSEPSQRMYFRAGRLRPARELMDWYEQHNTEVQEWCAAGSIPLLTVCWQNGDGWNKLAPFLNQNRPTTPFPWENKGRYVNQRTLREPESESAS